MRVNPVNHVSRPSIREAFLDSLDDMSHVPNRNIHGDMLFTKVDVLSSKDQLTQMLRAICVARGITKQFLTTKYREYASNVLQEAPSKMSTGAGNLLSAVKRDPVSFKTFMNLFACVLGHDIDLTIKLTDPEGKVEHYNYTKTLDDVINSINDQE